MNSRGTVRHACHSDYRRCCGQRAVATQTQLPLQRDSIVYSGTKCQLSWPRTWVSLSQITYSNVVNVSWRFYSYRTKESLKSCFRFIGGDDGKLSYSKEEKSLLWVSDASWWYYCLGLLQLYIQGFRWYVTRILGQKQVETNIAEANLAPDL